MAMIADELNFFEGETRAVRSANNGAVMISHRVNERIENPDLFKGVPACLPGKHVLASIEPASIPLSIQCAFVVNARILPDPIHLVFRIVSSSSSAST